MKRLIPFKRIAEIPKRGNSPEALTCFDTYASLVVYTGEEHPDKVSSLLNLEPSFVEFIPKDATENDPERLSCWCLQSAEAVHSSDVREHISWILSTVEGAEGNFTELAARGWKARIICLWTTTRLNSDIFLDNDLLRRASVLGLHLDFDVWFLPPT